jgi:prevent-host-death family protein
LPDGIVDIRAQAWHASCTISSARATLERMKEVELSEFKAKCTAILEQLQKTKEPVLVMRRGKPLAELVPPSPKKRVASNREGHGLRQRNNKSKTKAAPPGARVSKKRFLGSMKGQIKILGDIVSPVIDLDDIEALRD